VCRVSPLSKAADHYRAFCEARANGNTQALRKLATDEFYDVRISRCVTLLCAQPGREAKRSSSSSSAFGGFVHTLQVLKGSVIEPSNKLKREWESKDLRVKVLALRMVMLQVRARERLHTSQFFRCTPPRMFSH
jgi:hypothetical protein